MVNLFDYVKKVVCLIEFEEEEKKEDDKRELLDSSGSFDRETLRVCILFLLLIYK